jgi:uncharacterized SAM-binding protein YcdF (DUF218 family)
MSWLLSAVSPLAHPLGLVWIALLAAAIVCLRRKRPVAAGICGAAWFLLWLVGQPPVVNALLARLERPWISRTLEHAPAADAVIVLGGGWRRSEHDFLGLDMTPSADRWINGLELCRRGRAPVLVIGGDPPNHSGPPPSSALEKWLRDWKLDGIRVETLGVVGNTRDEAVSARALAEKHGWRNVLLVTSAFHMRRSLAAFQRAGVSAHPVACDFQAIRGAAVAPRWRPFPDLEAIIVFNLWWHEEVGWIAYKLLGRV